MDSTRHLILSLLLAFFIIVLGTTGYVIIEGWEILDAVYMTIITLATVGYGEVHAISRIGKIYTILLIILGTGFYLYILAAVVQFMVEGRIRILLGRRRLDKKINRLRNHYIVCGYGRIGKVLCKKLRLKPIDLVVIEKNPELNRLMDEEGILYLSGDAADESTLLKAGIEHAKGLVAILDTDTENVFLVLTARQLNPDLFIMARANQHESKVKLRAAGATQVESPYEMGAASMAQRILRPTVTSFLDFALADKRKDIRMEEIPVSPSSNLVNVILKDSGIRQKYNLIIIAVKKPDGNMLFNPSFETMIKADDTVIAVGEETNLQKLERILNP
ncbi:MAG: potassium channel protein [Desulfobacterales bacterium]|nr:potassium channel protein [Desulfobacterales bacterium]